MRRLYSLLAVLFAILLVRTAGAEPLHVPFYWAAAPDTSALVGPLPHKSEFQLDVIVPASYTRADVTYWIASDAACTASSTTAVSVGVAQEAPKDGRRTIPVRIPALEYSTQYCFRVTLRRTWTADDTIAAKRSLLALLKTSPSKEDATTVAAYLRAAVPAAKLMASANKDVAQPIGEHFMGTSGWQVARSACKDFPNQVEGARTAAAELLVYMSPIKAPESNITALAQAFQRMKLPESPSDPAVAAQLSGLLAAISEYESFCAQPNRVGTPACTTEQDLKKRQGLGPGSLADLKASIDNASERQSKCVRYTDDLMAGEIDLTMSSLEGDLKTAASEGTGMTATPGYTERAPFYISGDIGGAIPIFPGSGADFALYGGVSFTFVPLDKDVPLRGLALGKRFSLNAGVTFTDVKDPAKTAKGVLDGKGVLLGAGFRVTDYVRIAAGAILIRQIDGAGESVRATPYISASIDIDVVGTVRSLMAKANP